MQPKSVYMCDRHYCVQSKGVAISVTAMSPLVTATQLPLLGMSHCIVTSEVHRQRNQALQASEISPLFFPHTLSQLL